MNYNAPCLLPRHHARVLLIVWVLAFCGMTALAILAKLDLKECQAVQQASQHSTEYSVHSCISRSDGSLECRIEPKSPYFKGITIPKP